MLVVCAAKTYPTMQLPSKNWSCNISRSIATGYVLFVFDRTDSYYSLLSPPLLQYSGLMWTLWKGPFLRTPASAILCACIFWHHFWSAMCQSCSYIVCGPLVFAVAWGGQLLFCAKRSMVSLCASAFRWWSPSQTCLCHHASLCRCA